ncbi:hypothetical protein [Runella sp.]|uniref:hypothetical protein n=1 Tax=Runella sp. TaxID=1960881 RepID=UPI003D106725
MKKICTLLLFAANTALAQSIILDPSVSASVKTKTATETYGLEHTSGTIRINTYVEDDPGSIHWGGWLQTTTNHPLIFSTANASVQLYLSNNGNIILNPSNGKPGNVGIGLPVLTVPAEKLTVQGNIRASSLAGTGSRTVSADANGTLTAAVQTYTVMIPPQDFQRRYNSGGGTFTSLGFYSDAHIMGNNISEDLVAAATIPVGATVTQVQVYFTDNDPTNNLRFVFSSTAADDANSIAHATLFQNTANPQPYTITTLTSALFSSAVTAERYYTIQVSPVNSTGNYGTGVWNYNTATPTVNRMSVKGVKITYTL